MYGAEKLSKLSTSEFNLFRFNWNNPSAIDDNFKLWNVHWGKSYSEVQNIESKLTLLCAVWAFFCDDMKGRLLFREDLAMDGRRVGGTAIKNIELRELNYWHTMTQLAAVDNLPRYSGTFFKWGWILVGCRSLSCLSTWRSLGFSSKYALKKDWTKVFHK